LCQTNFNCRYPIATYSSFDLYPILANKQKFADYQYSSSVIDFKQTDRHRNRQTDKQTDRQIERQTDRKTGRQKDRQTERQTDR
jgi:hypothetical protein